MTKITKLSFKKKEFDFLEMKAREAKLPVATFLKVVILNGLEVPPCRTV